MRVLFRAKKIVTILSQKKMWKNAIRLIVLHFVIYSWANAIICPLCQVLEIKLWKREKNDSKPSSDASNDWSNCHSAATYAAARNVPTKFPKVCPKRSLCVQRHEPFSSPLSHKSHKFSIMRERKNMRVPKIESKHKNSPWKVRPVEASSHRISRWRVNREIFSCWPNYR